MSYYSVIEMANSASLIGRVTACAAGEKIADPESWTRKYLWRICASPGWATQWESASNTLQINQNPDLGARTDVITDGNILSAVQAVVALP